MASVKQIYVSAPAGRARYFGTAQLSRCVPFAEPELTRGWLRWHLNQRIIQTWVGTRLEKKKGERALSLQSARSKVGALGSAFNLVLVAEFSRKILLGGVGAFGYLQSHVHILAKLRAKRGYAYGEISGC